MYHTFIRIVRQLQNLSFPEKKKKKAVLKNKAKIFSIEKVCVISK